MYFVTGNMSSTTIDWYNYTSCCNMLTSVENKIQCSEEDEGGTHFTPFQTLALLANKITFRATQKSATVILIVTQTCV